MSIVTDSCRTFTQCPCSITCCYRRSAQCISIITQCHAGTTMSTRRVTYSNGVIYFILRVILNTGFSIITDSYAVHCTSFGIVTKSNPIITIMCCTVTDSYALYSLRKGITTDSYAMSKILTFIIFTCHYISTCTHSYAIFGI